MGYIIDDRPYIPDPSKPDNTIYITAQKRGKNGNVKKTVALKTAGGAHTVELIEQLQRETADSGNSRCRGVTISIAAEPECEVMDDERKFLKIIEKMMK